MTYQYGYHYQTPEELLENPYSSKREFKEARKRAKFLTWLELQQSTRPVSLDLSKININCLMDVEFALSYLQQCKEELVDGIGEIMFDPAKDKIDGFSFVGEYNLSYADLDDDDLHDEDDYISYASKYSNPDLGYYAEYEDAIEDCEDQIDKLESKRRRLIQAMKEEEEEREREEEEEESEEEKEREEKEAEEEEEEFQDLLDAIDRYKEEHDYD